MITGQLIAAALRAAAAVFDTDVGGNATIAPNTYTSPPPPPPPPAAIAATGVTAEQITDLIVPHVPNETIKAALGVAMREFGINALGEAPPTIYDALYAKFKGVLVAHGVGVPSAGGAPVSPPPPASII